MKKILGVFDLLRSGGSLGSLLILLEELEIQKKIHGASKIDILVVNDAAQLLKPGAMPSREIPEQRMNFLKSVAHAMTNVEYCVATESQVAHVKYEVRWPDPDKLVKGEHNYDSTGNIRKHFEQTRGIPRLSVTQELENWAHSYFREQAEGHTPVAVHLKNNPHSPGQSNANFESWESLFSSACCRSSHFFLIGDDETPDNISRLRNVTLVKKDKIKIDGYLALIQTASLFMGMMSGPANMALFGTTPYLIFKNPDHHAKEMQIELGNSDRYSFALDGQRVLRIWDTPENLVNAFESITHTAKGRG